MRSLRTPLRSCESRPVTIDGHKLRLYEFTTGRRRSIAADRIDNPVWSRDGAYLHYHSEGGTYMLQNVRVSDGKVETLVDLREYPIAPPGWNGLRPEDRPVVMRNLGATEVYALRLGGR